MLSRQVTNMAPNSSENPLQNDPDWRLIETWRQNEIAAVIAGPKNRVENRVGETPFSLMQMKIQIH